MPARSARARYVVWTALIAGAYLGMARFGLSLTVARGSATPVWAPTGIALAALILLGARYWPGVFIGAAIANALTPEPVWTAFVIAAGNTLEALAGAYLLRRGGFRSFGHVRDVVLFAVLAAGVATTISATVGAGVLALAGSVMLRGFASHWMVWWVGDAMGALLVAPLIISFVRGDEAPYTRARAFEAAAGLAILAGVSRVVFFSDRLVYSYLIFPVMIWAALRFRQRGATAAAFVCTSMGIWATISGSHAFGGANATESVEILQALMSVVSFASLVLAATITEREHAQGALVRESALTAAGKASLAEAQRIARVGSWDWDIERGVLTWSDEMYRIYGLPIGSQVTFESVVGLLDPEDRARMQRDMEAGYERGADHDLPGLEYSIVTGGGERRMLQGRGRLLFRDGHAIRLVGTVQDVTDLKAAELKLREAFAREREATERLRAVDEMKDTFLTAVSHDLRTPLTALVGFASILRDRAIALTDEDREQLLDRLMRNAQHLDQMLSDLLDLDRIGSGSMTPRKRWIDLGALVRELLSHIEHDKHDVIVALDGVNVDADRSMLERMIENLVGNAVRYTPPGSHIWIRAERGDSATTLIVEDDGPGVRVDEADVIFQPFRQGATAPRHAPGVGIGLSLVARFAGAHGGRAWVAQRDGGGASFHVLLPDGSDAEERARIMVG